MTVENNGLIRNGSTVNRIDVVLIFCCVLIFFCSGCKKKLSSANTAFYYWKTSFLLDQKAADLLQQTAQNKVYLRFFDVVWNEEKNEVIPNALVDIRQDASRLNITPVVYITNKTFQHISVEGIDSLAKNVNQLINRIAVKNNIRYTQVQIDCDWSVTTRDKYFSFLKSFKSLTKRQLEATIRLHQVKYPERTGVPPVDKGLLMFYNMGKISANGKQANSIYNFADAEKYISSLPYYKLPLDVALPFFSWAIHIRNGKVLRVNNSIGKVELLNKKYFVNTTGEVYRAVKSFYLSGVYVKENDVFKLEEITTDNLNEAAAQVSKHLAKLKTRNIIYYELSSISASGIEAKDIREVSAHF